MFSANNKNAWEYLLNLSLSTDWLGFLALQKVTCFWDVCLSTFSSEAITVQL